MTDPRAANRRDGLYPAECFCAGASEQALKPSPTRYLELILVPADELGLALYQAPSAWVWARRPRRRPPTARASKRSGSHPQYQPDTCRHTPARRDSRPKQHPR